MAGPIGAVKAGFGALGILGDVNDILSPQDNGNMGWADRGIAATNAGFLTADLVGADLVMDAIPGVGEVAIAATGIYLAGDYLYHRWTPFRDVANDAGHAVFWEPLATQWLSLRPRDRNGCIEARTRGIIED